MSIRTLSRAFGLALILAAGGALAQSSAPKLLITDLWTRATPPGAPTAGGYLAITNTGGETDRLIAVSSPMAEEGQLHSMAMQNGIAVMRPLEDGIVIPPGKTVTLAPEGLHVMFIDLKQPLKEGDELPVVLTFERIGRVETYLHVLAIGAKGPGDAPDHAAHSGRGT
jgi:copper(I)-binding protein